MTPRPRRYARAVARPVAGRMNGTEEAYAAHLAARKAAGEVEAFSFEPVKLRLAPSTFYTPDFLVVMADGTLELHEVKAATTKPAGAGRNRELWEDDARVKIKLAATLFPWFRFRSAALLPKRAGRGWQMTEFEP